MIGKEQENDPRQTVLIVEDKALLAAAMAATLDLEGLRPVVANDGDQALSFAHSMHPDLILLDVMLPSRSGIEVCATLKTNPETMSIPVRGGRSASGVEVEVEGELPVVAGLGSNVRSRAWSAALSKG